ncbi:transposase, orf A [Erwinia pyrifoliae Ep1/96]|nr:transposase, orf A [Erwinia pyrifoliae Ep1/96]
MTLRNIKGFRFNHKRLYRIDCELSLNMRIKPKKRLKRNKPEPLAVPENSNECGSMASCMIGYRMAVPSVY